MGEAKRKSYTGAFKVKVGPKAPAAEPGQCHGTAIEATSAA
jgi:hypothetical protein